MWTPFWAGSRSTVQSISAAISFSPPPWRIRIALLTPRTPARDSAEPHLGRRCLQVGCEKLPGLVHRRNATNALLPEDPQFARARLARVPRPAHAARDRSRLRAHARAHRGSRRDDRALRRDDRRGRRTQLAELLDDLALAARIEGGRYDPPLRAADTLELARSPPRNGSATSASLVSGDGAVVELDAEAAERAVGALARCALRHGGFEQVELAVRGPELALSPVTPASAPVVLGEDLRDLGAAVAVRVVQARGGSVAVDEETLTIRLT